MSRSENSTLIAAIAFAADKHRNQRRKDAEASPYINHPIALANLLVNEAGVEDQRVLVAAVLHDTVEDTMTTEQELVRHFGKEVADIVIEVTDDKALPKAERKRLQVAHAPHISRRARLVKLADKICNLRDITTSPPADWSVDRKREYFDWAKAVVDGLRGVHPGLEHLFDIAYEARPVRGQGSRPPAFRTLPRSTTQNRLFLRIVRLVELRLALGRLAPQEAGAGRFLGERHRDDFVLRRKPRAHLAGRVERLLAEAGRIHRTGEFGHALQHLDHPGLVGKALAGLGQQALDRVPVAMFGSGAGLFEQLGRQPVRPGG